MLKSVVQLTSGIWFAQLISMFINLAIINILPVDEYAELMTVLVIVSTSTASIVSCYNRIKIKSKEMVPYYDVFIIGFLVLVGVLMYGLYLGKDFKTIIFAVTLGFLTSTLELIKTSCQTRNIFKKFSIIVAQRAFIYLFIITLIYLIFGLDFYAVFIAIIVSYLVAIIANVKELSRQSIGFKQNLDKKHVYLFIYFLIIPSYLQIPFIYLSKHGDSYQVAIYATAMTVMLILNTVINAFKKILIIKLRDGVNIKEVVRAISISLTPLLGILLVNEYIGDEVLNIISDNKYGQASSLVSVLTISAFFSLLFSPFSEVLQLKEKYFFQLTTVIVCATLAIVSLQIFSFDITALNMAYMYLMLSFMLNGIFLSKVLYTKCLKKKH